MRGRRGDARTVRLPPSHDRSDILSHGAAQAFLATVGPASHGKGFTGGFIPLGATVTTGWTMA